MYKQLWQIFHLKFQAYQDVWFNLNIKSVKGSHMPQIS